MSRADWILDRSKYLSRREAKRLLRIARHLAETGLLYDHRTPVRDYFIIDLALATGLRVTEMAQLDCGDIYIDEKTVQYTFFLDPKPKTLAFLEHGGIVP